MRVLDFSVNFVYQLCYFLPWYYLDNLSFWVRFIPRTVALAGNSLAIIPMARNLLRPYRAIHTWVAYAIGFVVRLIWILAAAVLILALLGILLVILAVYWLLPLVALVWLAHRPEHLFGLGLLGALGILYLKLYILRPKKAGELTLSAEKVWHHLVGKPYSPVVFLRDGRKNKRLREVFQRLDLDVDVLIQKIESERNRPTKLKDQAGQQKIAWRDLLDRAQKLRADLRHQFVDLDLLFVALIKLDRQVFRALTKLEVHPDEVVKTVAWVEAKKFRQKSWQYWKDEYFHLWAGPDRAWVAGFLPNLKHFSTDITKLVALGKVPRVMVRRQVVEAVLAVLNRTAQNNVILVGPAGVGKTSIVYAIAQEMLTGEASGKLREKKLIALDVGGLLAGSGTQGELEARIKAALTEVLAGQVVLFVDEIESLLRAGFEYFLPSISAGELQLIGTATPENYKKYIESSSQIAAQFQVVTVPEPDDQEVYQILEDFSARVEKEQDVVITFPAIKAATRLTRRYIHDRVLPDKAIDLLDETAVRKGKEGKVGNKKTKIKVTPEDVAKVLSLKISVPLEKITQSETEKLLHLERILHQRIVGQDEAISAIANALRRARAGLAPQNRPLASFLFVGPTGVGKTETTKVLAESYFGSEQNIVRLDMSEYTEKQNLTRLIGAPPGFPGFREGGQLTEAVRTRPFTVILADEFEKAHPDVLNLFLQILDDGRLTDGLGRTADFTNTMVIATSNAFSQKIYEYLEDGKLGSWKTDHPTTQLPNHQVGERYDYLKNKLLLSLQKIFKPELLNRFDDIIVFRPLKFEEQVKITHLLLREVSAELMQKDIVVSFTSELVRKLVELGFNPSSGARPLRRVIQEKVENPLAEKILKGELKAGDEIKVGTEILEHVKKEG